jgi:tryptophanyl-tRNA synthetase
MHAITVPQDPDALHRNIINAIAMYIACGVDPNLENMHIYIQSENLYHANLSWIFECHTPHGDLTRMHQFKAKSALHETFTEGLVTYPDLMAADILLYQTELVPVGVDQKQHLELARDIAQRFNGQYSDTFVVPEGYIAQTGMKIMSLAEPTAKMSKSDPNPNAIVYILDSKDDILRKFKRAVTDSGCEVRAGEGKDGINNLMTIYRCFTGKTNEEIEAEFTSRGYGDFKLAVGEACADALAPVREEYARLIADKAYLESVMKEGAEAAAYCARKTITKVKRKLGFVTL